MAKKTTKKTGSTQSEKKNLMTAENFSEAMHGNISKIVCAYVLIMFSVFPLFMTNMYYNILKDKYYFTWYATAGMFIAVIVAAIGGYIFDKKYFDGVNVKKYLESWKFSNIKKEIRLTDIFAIALIVICIISTIASEWPYEAFWGNMGRFHGCFLCLWYFVAYIFVSRYYEFKRWHVDIFLAIGLILCIWGISDYFGEGFIGWHTEARDNTTAWAFATSIGNIDTVTSVEGMYLMLAMIFYIDIDPVREIESSKNIRTLRAKKLLSSSNSLDKWITSNGVLTPTAVTGLRKGFYFLCAAIAYMSMMCNVADNALITIGIAICFIPFYAFRTGRGIKRYILLLAVFVGTMALTGMMTKVWEGKISPTRGILLNLAIDHTNMVKLLFAALLVVYIIAFLVIPDKETKYIRKIWLVLGILASAALIYVVIDANSGNHKSLYEPFESILIFNDEWGSQRGYVWRGLVMKHFKEFSPLKKLIGSGPETFGIITTKYDYNEMITYHSVVFDSPHNEALQHLFNIGILGALSYYALIVSSVVCGFKAGSIITKDTDSESVNESLSKTALEETKRTAGAAFAFLIIGYSAQALINIVVPISLPFVVLSVCICAKLGRDKKRIVSETV